MGTGLPPWGPPPHPGPAVRSGNGSTALHLAALFCNLRIIRLLVAFGADVNARTDDGCAVCACGESAVSAAGRVPASVCRAGRRRCTWPRTMSNPTMSRCRIGSCLAMAIPQPLRSCCCAAPTGPSRTTAGNAALRRTAEPKTATAARGQVHAEAMGGTQREQRTGRDSRGVRGGGEPGALRPPAHSPRPLRSPSLPALLVPTDVPSVLAVGARRSSGQGGDRPL